MGPIHVQASVSGDGTLTIKGLPALAGHKVDVTVEDRDRSGVNGRYPLRGKPAIYDKPFDSVAEADWEAQR
jgi:hypothetical protein